MNKILKKIYNLFLYDDRVNNIGTLVFTKFNNKLRIVWYTHLSLAYINMPTNLAHIKIDEIYFKIKLHFTCRL